MSADAREPVGTLAEEAARLMEAAHGWAGALTSGVPIAGRGEECSVCPVCQLVRALRGVKPETVEHLVAATTSLAAALRSVVDAAGGHAQAGSRRASPVEHIDVD